MRLRIHEIVAPDMVPMLRTQPDTTAIVQPQSLVWRLANGNLQPLPPPPPGRRIAIRWTSAAAAGIVSLNRLPPNISSSAQRGIPKCERVLGLLSNPLGRYRCLRQAHATPKKCRQYSPDWSSILTRTFPRRSDSLRCRWRGRLSRFKLCRRLVDLSIGISRQPSLRRGPSSCLNRIIRRVAMERAVFAVHLIPRFVVLAFAGCRPFRLAKAITHETPVAI
jgi:hypothetical protein